MRHNQHKLVNRLMPALLASLLALPAFGQELQTPGKPAAGQPTFSTPEEALAALSAAVSSNDRAALMKLFGPAGEDISSGDEVSDKANYEAFLKRLGRMTNLVKKDDSTVILYLGAENWPFPLPINRAGDRWFFDGEAGMDEMLDRRIGANELTTIRVCHEYVRAQREYSSEDRDGDEVLEYAQRMGSNPGSKDGLYWESEDGEESPFGPLLAYANTQGYKQFNEEPEPFNGYYYRIIKQQGPKAPGRAYNYVINGNMIGGFALVAYPARWGNSGLMTFIVNQQGKVYQKDLGRNTAATAAGMRIYNPDSTWKVVEED